MKLAVLAVGKLKEQWVLQGCEEYRKRIRRASSIDVIEVKDLDQLAARIPPRHHVVALSERGQMVSSTELAERIRGWQLDALPGVAFLIGGADGLGPLEQRAHARLSLSRLTLPHRLARLVLLEQLYRAFSILRGEPYHRE